MAHSVPGRPKNGDNGATLFYVCILRNSDQIGTKFGTNKGHFIVNIVT